MKKSLILFSLCAFGSTYATNTNIFIKNNTPEKQEVGIPDSDHFDCQLPGQIDTFNCGNDDGDSQSPGALRHQVIPPFGELKFQISQDGISEFTNLINITSSSMLLELVPGGDVDRKHYVAMWTDSNIKLFDPDYRGTTKPNEHYDNIAPYNHKYVDTEICEGNGPGNYHCQKLSMSGTKNIGIDLYSAYYINNDKEKYYIDGMNSSPEVAAVINIFPSSDEYAEPIDIVTSSNKKDTVVAIDNYKAYLEGYGIVKDADKYLFEISLDNIKKTEGSVSGAEGCYLSTWENGELVKHEYGEMSLKGIKVNNLDEAKLFTLSCRAGAGISADVNFRAINKYNDEASVIIPGNVTKIVNQNKVDAFDIELRDNVEVYFSSIPDEYEANPEKLNLHIENLVAEKGSFIASYIKRACTTDSFRPDGIENYYFPNAILYGRCSFKKDLLLSVIDGSGDMAKAPVKKVSFDIVVESNGINKYYGKYHYQNYNSEN